MCGVCPVVTMMYAGVSCIASVPFVCVSHRHDVRECVMHSKCALSLPTVLVRLHYGHKQEEGVLTQTGGVKTGASVRDRCGTAFR